MPDEKTTVENTEEVNEGQTAESSDETKEIDTGEQDQGPQLNAEEIVSGVRDELTSSEKEDDADDDLDDDFDSEESEDDETVSTSDNDGDDKNEKDAEIRRLKTRLQKVEGQNKARKLRKNLLLEIADKDERAFVEERLNGIKNPKASNLIPAARTASKAYKEAHKVLTDKVLAATEEKLQAKLEEIKTAQVEAWGKPPDLDEKDKSQDDPAQKILQAARKMAGKKTLGV